MHKKIGKWLSACDILVLPSYNEGLPNAVVEAMACRRPVIATQVGGIPEIIVNNKNGILVPLKDVQELYSKIMLLCKNNKMAEELGNAGYNTVIEKFSWDKSAKQITDIYKKILKL
jgi:glycosyltransferase involved in cell wall biosynthesis